MVLRSPHSYHVTGVLSPLKELAELVNRISSDTLVSLILLTVNSTMI